MSSPETLIPVSSLTAKPFLVAESADFPVALVCMPWGVVNPPALAMGILKRCLARVGFHPELHYLNLRFARQIGMDIYENISKEAHLFYPDWYFSYSLFGPGGTGELKNGWDDIAHLPIARELVRTMRDKSKAAIADPEDVCRRVAQEEVPRYLDDCMSSVDWARYRVVGFTTTFAQSLASLSLAKRIKERYPEITMIFGGANVDADMGVEFIRAFEWIDYVVHGEAEVIFPALLGNLMAGHQERLPGVSLRSNGTVVAGHSDAKPIPDMNDSPAPDYSDYINQMASSGLKRQSGFFLYYESSRGCWWGAKHHCTFCGLNGTTLTHRQKSPANVYEEIMELARAYNCTTLAATDNILSLDYFGSLMPKLAASDLDLQLFYEVKANLNRDQMRMLSNSGIRQVQPGIESLNTRLLKLMRKGITAIQNIQFLRWCYEFDIKPYWNVLYGFPGETPDDYRELPSLVLSVSHLYPPGNVAPVIFERFSPYFFDRDSFGIEVHPDPAYMNIYPESRVALQEIAYFFKQNRGPDEPQPDDYTMPSREAIAWWSTLFHRGESYCHYRRGPGYVIVDDCRPAVVGGTATHKQICLKGTLAQIYTFCDEIRTSKSICEFIRQSKGSEEVTEDEVQTHLDRLVFQRLLYREDNRYLALAVRRKSIFYSSKTQ